MRRADLAAGDERAQHLRHIALAWMRAKRVDARIERRVGAKRGIDRKRAGNQRRVQYALQRKQRGERERSRYLRAVEQRQTLFRAELERSQSATLQRRVGRHLDAADARTADADHG